MMSTMIGAGHVRARTCTRTASIRRAALVSLLAGMMVARPSSVQAQAETQDVEVEPLTCWWRTTRSSVRVAEPFTLVLTCATVETQSTRVVADTSRLDPAVVQLPPYEVIGGARGDDLRTESQRFVQYSYTLRLLTEDAFGRDVPIPPLEVSYRIETRTGGDAASQGRELAYTLPPLAMRIDSLVPNTALDIREADPVTLADIERRLFRANMLRGAAALLVALGVIALVLGLVRIGRRETGTTQERQLAPADMLRAIRSELIAIRQQGVREGWSSEVGSRALAALRVVASAALGRTIAQRSVTSGVAATEGEVLITRGWPRMSTLVSGSATARSAAIGPAPASESDRLLSEVREGLASLTAHRYGPSEERAGEDIARALESGAQLAGRLAQQHGWGAAIGTRVREGAQRWGMRAWSS